MSGRWYELTLIPPTAPGVSPIQFGAVTTSANGTTNIGNTTTQPPAPGVRQWGSNLGGTFDPAAQNIEFDVLTTPYDEPTGSSVVILQGPDLDDLTQAHQFAGYTLTLKAGMKDGLPLSADQGKPGLILQGVVVQGFGNWVGTDMELAFVITAGIAYDYENPGNIVLHWQSGQQLTDALTLTFKTAFPALVPDIQISPSLVLPYTETGMYSSLSELSRSVRAITRPMNIAPNYQGVRIWVHGNKIIARDFTVSSGRSPVQINFNDLIGQPTWIAQDTIQVVTVLRSDVGMGGCILMPKNLPYGPGTITTSPSLQNSYQNFQASFTGSFVVTKVRQIGNSRNSDGQQWVTVIEAIANKYVSEAPL